ncbi:alpha/beta hydrolase family protein [Alienimonas chondri]|uniref:Dienelactone hydrolase n=1 Tax=Alienimonas chondri TaxID=2681879 RepID=A0ABX1VC44_9PLAN|nr:dienelactone hydrolase [Alienimonas chondri]NNJ25264.1 hypothetical protein [Alienimonas chondri]
MIALAFFLSLTPQDGAATPPVPDAAPQAAVETYDPLAVAEGAAAGEPIDLDVQDADRDRVIPIRVRLPVMAWTGVAKPAPVLLFSHGLGGSRAGGTYLAEHWAARGYVCVNLQHPGSDEAVWKEARPLARMAAMKQAASGENYFLRVQDVPAVLDRLERWNAEEGHPLFGRLDLSRVGMSGHSFGAQTTQAVSGQTAPGIGRRLAALKFTDERIDAAAIFSPSPPSRGAPEQAFGSVAVPWLLMTGTKDDSPIGQQTPESRLNVFPHLPDAIDRYQLVLKDAEHSAFADARPGAGARRRNPNHHRAILALTTAFWDANLKRDPAAAAWLNGEEAERVLEADDDWQVRRAGRE